MHQGWLAHLIDGFKGFYIKEKNMISDLINRISILNPLPPTNSYEH